jgi:hypothetical protein
MSGNDPDTQRSWRAPGLENPVDRRPRLDAAAQARLGSVLARYADRLIGEPLPEAFLSLLAKLQAKEPEE